MAGKIIVTGGAGFIGSALVSRLNKDGRSDIIIVDNLRSGEKWRNLVNLRFEDFIHKEPFLDLIIQEALPFDISAIVHMGACSSTTEKDADYLMENNFHYTKILAEFSLKHSVRFIYASSAATYGLGDAGYDDDVAKLRTLRPLNMYGYSKHLFDLWAAEQNILDTIVGVKFFNVYGPNEYHKGDMKSMVFKAFEQINAQGKVKLFKSGRPNFKDGEQMRDFVYVKDAVEVLAWLLKDKHVNGLFNLGFGKARTWNDLMKAVFAAMKREVRIDYIDMPPGLDAQYQYFTEAPMEKLKKAGYPKTFMPLEEAVNDYVSNYLMTAEKFL